MAATCRETVVDIVFFQQPWQKTAAVENLLGTELVLMYVFTLQIEGGNQLIFGTPDCVATLCGEQGHHLILKNHHISIQIEFEEVCSQCRETSTD